MKNEISNLNFMDDFNNEYAKLAGCTYNYLKFVENGYDKSVAFKTSGLTEEFVNKHKELFDTLILIFKK